MSYKEPEPPWWVKFLIWSYFAVFALDIVFTVVNGFDSWACLRNDEGREYLCLGMGDWGADDPDDE